MTYDIFVPFSGFYESIHNERIGNIVQHVCSDEDGNLINDMYDMAYTLTNFKLIRELYSKKYVSALADEIGTHSLTYKSLISPKYYNFETDRILATISYRDLNILYSNLAEDTLEKFIVKNHSSTSGFHSFYSNSLYEWKKKHFSMWDCNQLGTVLEAYLETKHDFSNELASTLLEYDTDWIYNYIETE